jgi:hypothetical protein
MRESLREGIEKGVDLDILDIGEESLGLLRCDNTLIL